MTETITELPAQLLQLVKKLNEQELHSLHHLISDRLNLIHTTKTLQTMRKFMIMDQVTFTYKGKTYNGTISRINQKTITVIVDDGSRWTVSPQMLSKSIKSNPLKQMLTKKQ